MSQQVALVPAGQDGPQAGGSSTGLPLEKQQQKAIKTRVLDHVGPYLRLVQARLSAPHVSSVSHLQPVFASSLELLPPCAYPQLPASSIGTKFVTSSFFRHRAAVNHLLYTPDGRRLLCAGNNGNVSLWNGTNFENELGPGIQAHEASPIRCMVFSHSGLFLLSCDDLGRVKFSRPTLEVLQVYQAHKEPCRSVTFSPTDYKFATGSDDSTVRVFDTFRGQEASMTGHGGDVRWVDWHPTKGVIASCSKDACVKLWDPRAAGCLSTLHGHKNGIFQAKWNRNGHWLLTCSRDQLLKLYDVRMLKEVATFAGHGRDVTCCAWHPQHEELFVSGAIDGSLVFWMASRPDAQGCIPAAHEATVWSAAWHPLGHVLATAGADQKCQFWCRKRPGDIWQDSYGQDLTAGGAGGAATATAAFGDAGGAAAAALGPGAGLLGPAGGGAVGGLFGGPLPASLPGLAGGSAAPGAAAASGGAAAAARPNVIPGIGAVLDQLATANLQSLMAAVQPGGGGSGGAAGGSGRPGAGTGAGSKRGREEGPRPNLRFGDRGDRERDFERDRDRGGRERERERVRDRDWERGPPKHPRMDGGFGGGGDGLGPVGAHEPRRPPPGYDHGGGGPDAGPIMGPGYNRPPPNQQPPPQQGWRQQPPPRFPAPGSLDGYGEPPPYGPGHGPGPGPDPRAYPGPAAGSGPPYRGPDPRAGGPGAGPPMRPYGGHGGGFHGGFGGGGPGGYPRGGGDGGGPGPLPPHEGYHPHGQRSPPRPYMGPGPEGPYGPPGGPGPGRGPPFPRGGPSGRGRGRGPPGYR